MTPTTREDRLATTETTPLTAGNPTSPDRVPSPRTEVYPTRSVKQTGCSAAVPWRKGVKSTQRRDRVWEEQTMKRAVVASMCVVALLLAPRTPMDW